MCSLWQAVVSAIEIVDGVSRNEAERIYEAGPQYTDKERQAHTMFP